MLKGSQNEHSGSGEGHVLTSPIWLSNNLGLFDSYVLNHATLLDWLVAVLAVTPAVPSDLEHVVQGHNRPFFLLLFLLDCLTVQMNQIPFFEHVIQNMHQVGLSHLFVLLVVGIRC